MSEAAQEWVLAGRADEVETDVATEVVIGTVEIALCRVGDEIYALDNICTHERACLSDGWVDGDEIECPLHQARFHIPSGRVLAPPATVGLRTYPVKRVGNDVYVRIGSV